jgi:hypothetical protein
VTTVDVEIKVNFGALQIEQAKQVFGLDRESKDRKIWFGEVVTGRGGRGALPLLGRGVILRVRTKKKDSGDVTVKLRGPDGGIDETAWTKRVAGLDDAKIEGDWADRRLVSASLTADFGKEGRDELKAPRPSIGKLLSTAQTELAHELFVPVDAVRLLGPIAAQKWDPDDGIAAELWEVGGERFLEISVVAEVEPERAQQALMQRALDGGLRLEEGQEPKTTRVLKLLAGEAG